jgi:DNA-binding MarR family transcriptional regulator
MTYDDYKYLEQNPNGSTDEILFYFVYLTHERLAKSFEDFFKKNYSWSPSQTHLLCYLKYYETISMSQLADLMNTSRQRMTQLVDSLAERGLAKRSYDPHNRRAVYVQPTEEMLKQLDTGERRFISYLQHSISALPRDAQQKTIDAIRTTSDFLSNLSFETEDIQNAVF